jgi:mono/diheme cytochrome c family protein
LRRALGAALAAVAVVVAAGCGTGGLVSGGDASRGKQIFTQKCGSCHALADAGTSGAVGPNLDDAFRYARKQKVGNQDTIANIVNQQIKTAYLPMPDEDHLFPKCGKDQSPSPGGCSIDPGADTASVAVYVASVAGKGPATSPTPTTPAKPPPSQNQPAAQGKQVFAQAGCGACHTLKDAGTTGTVGPNLDDLKPDEPTVERQVTNGGGAMPPFKGQLSNEQIKAVASYVSSVAGK